MAPKLSVQARRLRMIIVTLPIIGATSFVLYKRLVWGEPRRTLPRTDAGATPDSREDRRIIPIKTVTGKTGIGAGSSGGGDEEALERE